MISRLCQDIQRELEADPRYRHTSHLRVEVAGELVHDAHLHGPAVAETFSITKSVLSTLVGIAMADGLVTDLDTPLGQVLDIRGTPAERHTLRHLLTMTRGCETAGEWDVDAVLARPHGWIRHLASAPQLTAPGVRFEYDGVAAHLLSAALTELVGRPLAGYAAERLFTPLGISDWEWSTDPDGIAVGWAHLRLSAGGLGALGRLWLDGGRLHGTPLVDPGYAAQMMRPQNQGGSPEGCPFGYLMWIDEHGPFAGGWAGQHVTLIPEADAVIVTTGDPRFDPGPPPRAELPDDWRPARDLVTARLVPALLAR
ncbi:CubicO group peptidase (beta-lactamase class C family) [Lentzea atacamensis]|uniref:CubicO group peptidase (Beta-lactamase class C family) n=1 Tax=Lentzea atacamensis TaxID=531938 RepID=A0ABX9EJF8_9PSEU|nr:serine hydrolase [Lentzea atacamensis]RAS69837.1 CubicO group peptidase (beta-lactamase class C family) [Lentzea atacamensis]